MRRARPKRQLKRCLQFGLQPERWPELMGEWVLAILGPVGWLPWLTMLAGRPGIHLRTAGGMLGLSALLCLRAGEGPAGRGGLMRGWASAAVW